jgi:hypothetical protein
MPTYAINAKKVSSENIDGEVIIVNLESGSYYSTVDAGAYIWGRITVGDSAEAITANLTRAFGDDGRSIEAAVAAFIGKLEAEQLIVKRNGAASHAADRSAPPKIVDAPLPQRFDEPVLNCYSDMQDMLVLDPVHDVADVGWPSAKIE